MRLPSGPGSQGGRRRREEDAGAAHGIYGRGRTRLIDGGGQRAYGADRGAPAYRERGERRRYPPRTGLLGGYGSGDGGPGYGPTSGYGGDGSGGFDGRSYHSRGYEGRGYAAPGYDGPGYAAPGYDAPGYDAPGYGQNGADGRHDGPGDRGDYAGASYGFIEESPDRHSGPDQPRHRRVRRRRYRRGRGAVRRLPAIPMPVFSAVAFVACVGLVVAGVGLSRANRGTSAAAAVAANLNCTLIVPENPLSPLGLATPYQLTATDPADGPCREANANQTAFVQGAIINTKTGQISIYDPLVIDEGATPAVAPVVPKLPPSSVVALWFGYNGDKLTLAGADQMAGVSPSQPMSADLYASVTSAASATALLTSKADAQATVRSVSRSSVLLASTSSRTRPSTAGYEFPAAAPTSDFLLQQANCVSGEDINGKFSTFTQVAACNATAFFTAADAAIAAGKLAVPSPGTAVDGQNCLTTRSFALVDQDQSDNVTTEYLAEPNGQIAQDTAANRRSLPRASVLFNGSDNGLLDLFVDPALHCTPWELPNQADNGALTSALPLDELQASAWAGQQGSGPMALVPLNDPMTVDNDGNFNTDKTDAYRAIVDMPPLPAGESPSEYCTDLEQIQGSRLQEDVNLLIKGPSPAPDEADNLFTFMAMRLQQSFVNLHCAAFGQSNDVSTTVNGGGVVVAACFGNQVAPLTPGAGNPMADRKTCPATTG